MTYTATVAINNVVLPDQHLYQAGTSVTISDTDYAQMGPSVVAAVLTSVVYVPPGAGAPSGPAGGDLTDTYPNPTIAATPHFISQVGTVRLDQLAAPAGSVSLNTHKITSLLPGTASTDAANVSQLPTAATPGASAVGDTAATGAASTFSASDHRHGRETFGAVTALGAFGTSASNGTSASVSHADHNHGAPPLPTATTSTAGIILLDGSAADIAALAAAAVAGTIGKAADAGHVHPTTGLLTALTAADTSLVVGGSAGTPTVRTNTLDVVATQHPAAADWSNNNHKITALANGTSPTDAAAYGQIPAIATLADITTGATRAAGATGRWADGAHVHGRDFFDGPDHGYLGWSFDPVECSSSGATPGSAGQLQAIRIHVPYAQTISTLSIYVITAGTSLTSGQNFIGLYNAAGNLLSAAPDQTTAWGTTGMKPATLSVAQAVAAGDYFVGFFYNGTGTVPAFARSSCGITGLLNANVSGFSCRFASGSSGNTTAMPSTTGALTALNNGYWVAWS